MDIVWGAIWVLGLLWILYLLKPKSRKLSWAAKARYTAELTEIRSMKPELGIINADRVLEQILRDLHGDWALGENLKKYYSQHPSRDKLWKYHKLRNRVVHEGETVDSFLEVVHYTDLIRELFLK